MKSTIGLFLLLPVLLASNLLQAQDEPQFSQYMAAPVLFNPAAAGVLPVWQSTLLVRQQWVGLPGAPASQAIVSDLPVYRLRGGLSFRLVNDVAGQQQTTTVQAGYAWHKPIGKALLSAGAYGGFAFRALDGSKLVAPDGSYEDVIDHNDPQLPVSLATGLAPDAGVGLWFEHPRWRSGVSVTRVLASRVNLTAENSVTSMQYQPTGHVFVSWRAIEQENFRLEPGVLIKSDLTEHMADINLLLSYRSKLLAGASYRLNAAALPDAAVVMAGWNVSEKWGLRYSYDIGLSELNNVQSGSHEVSITYLFPMPKPRAGKVIQNLRYLYY